MSSVIDEFLALQTDEQKQENNQNKYQSVWRNLRKQIDRFEEYRIAKTLDSQIHRNEQLVEELKYLMQIWEECKTNMNETQRQNENTFEHSLFQVPERQLLQKQILLNLKEIKRYSSKRNISIHLLLSFDSKSIHYNTLMYVMKPPNNSSPSTKYPSRPQTSFTVKEQKFMQNEIILSLTDDIIQQTASGMLQSLYY